MAKGQLANQLLGKMVKPDPSYGDVERYSNISDHTMNQRIWAGMQKNMNGEYVATIQAAWVDEDGNVKILITDPFGHSVQTWVTHVLVVSVN